MTTAEAAQAAKQRLAKARTHLREQLAERKAELREARAEVKLARRLTQDQAATGTLPGPVKVKDLLPGDVIRWGRRLPEMLYDIECDGSYTLTFIDDSVERRVGGGRVVEVLGPKWAIEQEQRANERERKAQAAVRETEQKIADLKEIAPAAMEKRVEAEQSAGQAPQGRRVMQSSEVGPMDPAALFLLSHLPADLFDPTPNPLVKRCRGCGADVKCWLLKQHQEAHKAKEGPVTTRGKASGSSNRVSGKGGGPSVTEFDPEVVARIIKDIERGIGAPTLQRLLAEEGITHANGKPWTHHQIRRAYKDAKGIKDADWKSKVRGKFGKPSEEKADKNKPARKTTTAAKKALPQRGRVADLAKQQVTPDPKAKPTVRGPKKPTTSSATSKAKAASKSKAGSRRGGQASAASKAQSASKRTSGSVGNGPGGKTIPPKKSAAKKSSARKPRGGNGSQGESRSRRGALTAFTFAHDAGESTFYATDAQAATAMARRWARGRVRVSTLALI
jgi:hypothetical protein